MEIEREDFAPILGISFISAIIAGFCCIAPVVLVLLSLSTVSFAAALNHAIETKYDSIFMFAGLLLLTLGIYAYRATKGKLHQSRIRPYINYFIVGLILFVVAYLLLHDFAANVVGGKLGLWTTTSIQP